MKRHPSEGGPINGTRKYWHKNMNWYGPSGIGTSRGIDGFPVASNSLSKCYA